MVKIHLNKAENQSLAVRRQTNTRNEGASNKSYVGNFDNDSDKKIAVCYKNSTATFYMHKRLSVTTQMKHTLYMTF